MCDCDVGTDRDIVVAPAIKDIKRPEDFARVREVLEEYARKMNDHQRSLVCLCAELGAFTTSFLQAIDRIDALLTLETQDRLDGDAALDLRVLALETLTATHTTLIGILEADLLAHTHTVTVGTAGGGEAVSLVGGAGGTLNTASGGDFQTDGPTIP